MVPQPHAAVAVLRCVVATQRYAKLKFGQWYWHAVSDSLTRAVLQAPLFQPDTRFPGCGSSSFLFASERSPRSLFASERRKLQIPHEPSGPMAVVLQTEDIIAFQALLWELSTGISRYQICFSLYAKMSVQVPESLLSG